MKKVIKIEGMMCPHCEAKVKKALEGIDGVDEAAPSHEADQAEITLSKEVAQDVLFASITEAGFKPVSME